jgi:hypothetical protein
MCSGALAPQLLQLNQVQPEHAVDLSHGTSRSGEFIRSHVLRVT